MIQDFPIIRFEAFFQQIVVLWYGEGVRDVTSYVTTVVVVGICNPDAALKIFWFTCTIQYSRRL